MRLQGRFLAQAFDQRLRCRRCRKGARAQGVDADAIVGPVNGQVPSHLQNAPLQRVISHRAGLPRLVDFRIRADQAIHRAEHDHAGRCSPGHRRIAHSACQQEVAGGVGQLLVEFLAGAVGQVGLHVLVAVVDEHVDVPREFDGRGKPALDRVGVQVIDGHSEVPARLGAAELCGALACLVAIAAGNDDTATGFGQGVGQRRPKWPVAPVTSATRPVRSNSC